MSEIGLNHPTANPRPVRPNARYDTIFGTNYALTDEEVLSEANGDLREETWRERAVLSNLDEEARDLQDRGLIDEPDADPDEVLTWEAVSVTESPQLLASICSYFTGVSSGEDVDEIRRKLRTLDVEWYVNAFLVARGILGDEEGGPYV